MRPIISRLKRSGRFPKGVYMNVIGVVSHAKMPPRNVPPRELKALKDLASDEDILVLPAYKGKATVVMNRADYEAKMFMMLNDESTYHPV